MHELGIIRDAVQLASETASLAGRSRVLLLRLKIGTLSGVDPDALEFAFQTVSEGTAVAGAQLSIETVPAACWCGGCQAEFELENQQFECPRCSQLSGKLLRGREIELASVEMS